MFSPEVKYWLDYGELSKSGLVYRCVIDGSMALQTEKELIHADQGVQYPCDDGRIFLKVHSLEVNMIRKGNCHDHAISNQQK